MRLPPLCRYLRGLILFLGVLLGARGADLGSLLADLGTLLGVSFGFWEKGCRQQLKTSKTAPLCSARPVLPKRLPPSVLAVRGDLVVFPYPKSSKNMQITTLRLNLRFAV